MKQLNVVFFVVAFIFLNSSAYGVDLAEMQQMAVSNRSIIQRYVTNLEKSEKDIALAKTGYYPTVDISYTATALDEATAAEAEENSTAVGIINWNVFAGFGDKYNVDSAELLSEVEKHQLRGIRQDVQLNVALAYLNVYERRANRMVAEDAFETLEKVYRDGESRYQVGLIGKNELLKFRVDYDNSDITLFRKRMRI